MARRFSVDAVFRGVDRVTAPVSRMQKRIGRFTRSVQRGMMSVNRVTSRMASGLRRGAAIAGIAVAGLALSLNSVADEADALAKQSRRLDFNIEALQEWQFVAEQSGVNTKQLGSALGAFSKRLGEAAGGAGPLVSGLKNINPELLEQLQATDSIADAFEMYIRAMRQADSATERAALANAAFSRSGLNLANIADNSTAAVEAMRQEMRDNGLITKDAAEDAEAYNDAVNSLHRTWRGFMAGVLLPLTPLLTDLIQQLRIWMNVNREIVASEILEWVDDLVANFQNVIKWAKRIGIAVGVFIAFQTVLNSLIGVLTLVNLLMMANPVVLVTVAVVALIAALGAMVFWWDEIKAAMTSFAVKAVAAFVNVRSKFREAFGAIRDFFNSLWDGVVDKFQRGVDRILSIVDRVKRAARGVTRFFGFGDDEGDEAERRARDDGQEPMVASPEERTARSIEERRSSADLTIRDETGRGVFKQRGQAPGIQFSVVPTGAFN